MTPGPEIEKFIALFAEGISMPYPSTTAARINTTPSQSLASFLLLMERRILAGAPAVLNSSEAATLPSLRATALSTPGAYLTFQTRGEASAANSCTPSDLPLRNNSTCLQLE